MTSFGDPAQWSCSVPALLLEAPNRPVSIDVGINRSAAHVLIEAAHNRRLPTFTALTPAHTRYLAAGLRRPRPTITLPALGRGLALRWLSVRPDTVAGDIRLTVEGSRTPLGRWRIDADRIAEFAAMLAKASSLLTRPDSPCERPPAEASAVAGTGFGELR
ncbi:hypothetical protein [Actinoalloteichus hymeniacidonis]|uniref:Uncharacterized protein n=1 Tax=Actinoalloteichus hymeniacidonis TaxID=340345 RepID=A0AAC9HRT7_9PSEU|nr:hypothetical protein [Actinoalloteichus hymeniacidonis]AOS64179.1 hypothetical protein TL08_16895 [Actinoalloteichus hymeniacidonis]MBB5907753.1 hypothetical protein [Actinoalloteichus hymeniacidonis]